MAGQVVLLHGWSDSSDSFKPLRDFLQAHDRPTTDIWLGDYISLDDDVRVEDVAKRMQTVIAERLASGDLTAPFDLIVHSTGALVAREWLVSYYPDGVGAPVKRLIMLAPANFGSKLAAKGKSLVGRVIKGWDNGFQTGQEMLDSLELASSYQWRLCQRDLLDATGHGSAGPFGRNKVWPFVIIGARGWESGLQQVVNEDGSDGTVRAAAANLNVHGITVDFSTNPTAPTFRVWKQRTDALIPFALLPQYTHGSIIRPQEGEGGLATRLFEALACETANEYASLADAWRDISEATYALATDRARRQAVFGSKPPSADTFHQYLQLIFYARDDHNRPVDDFFVEFYAPDQKTDKESVYFHTEVLAHAHTNKLNGARRCLYIDRTDLIANYYRKVAKANARLLAMSVSAAPIGRNIRYFDNRKDGASGHVVVHAQDLDDRENLPARFHRNSTHLIELILPREPIPDVFTLKR